MKKIIRFCTAALFCLAFFSGCSSKVQIEPQKTIPFEEGQTYAVAHLGYQQMDDLDYYVQHYLDDAQPPIHYLSDGDYYLVIPRSEGTELSLYRNDMETSQPVLIYREYDCRPFIVQCNVSDIFPDVTIRLTHEGETVEFSPFLSLKDGSLDIGEGGLELTRPEARS